MKKISLRIVQLQNTRDIARYSLITQNSISYLDLSICEYSDNIQVPYKNEDCRKSIDSRRKILYQYHLDEDDRLLHCNLDKLPEDMLNFTSFEFIFHFGKIIIPHSLYTARFADAICDFLQKSENKLDTLRRLLPAIKILEFRNHQDLKLLYKGLFTVIKTESPESPLALECVQALGNKCLSWSLFEGDIYILDKVLKLAKMNQVDLFMMHSDTINFYLFEGKSDIINLVIDYGYVPQFEDLSVSMIRRYMDSFSFPPTFVEENKRSSLTKHRRQLLLFQLLLKYMNSHGNEVGRKDMQRIWRSIPDPYFTSHEIEGDLIRFGYRHPLVDEVSNFYITSLFVDFQDETPSIRPLSHLCRIKIREGLSRGTEVNHGIESLRLPEILKRFLRFGKNSNDSTQ